MITNELIDTVKNRLVEVYHPRAIYLFGSFAWGTPDEQSDLDLLVIIEQSDEKPWKRPVKGIKALFGLGVPNDLMVFTVEEFEQLADNVSTLCYKVKHEGTILYEAA